ncbi:hypothetical protein E3O06_11825 [Cryobacterium glaciale]|uniref:Uncharacterized protein n=1 Tax=Cryobacterium glaciale TaxID=1259145 RepID=A0A4R8UTD0_9MICO|nr:hypothetical protein [Cryobacterium glaciale]TFB71527.1 hypothetical protein E3O06_11825 [Cryobacterium glaciale]
MKIVLVEMDHQAGVSTFWRTDGKVATFDGDVISETPIAKSRFVPGESFLSMTTIRGEDLLFELPTVKDPSPLRARPVIYLDQNAWSKIATALHEPEKLNPDEAAAAIWLADLARGWKVILPFSAGTLSETSHWSDDDRRYKLAVTICELSHGWQMLDPLELRAAEMRWILSQHNGATGHPLPSVWTLAANAVYGQRLRPYDVGPDEGLDPDSITNLQAIIAISGTVATILDGDPIPRQDPKGWAEHWAQLASHVGTTNKPRHLTELAVHGAIIADARHELAQAAVDIAMDPETFGKWLNGPARRDIRRMPAFGLAREVTYLKISNSQAKWKPNDLTDIFYMVQASGYADAVVGERGFSTLARSAQQRLGRPENSFFSLTDLRRNNVFDDAPGRPPQLI